MLLHPASIALRSRAFLLRTPLHRLSSTLSQPPTWPSQPPADLAAFPTQTTSNLPLRHRAESPAEESGSVRRATASMQSLHLYVVASRNNTLVHLQSHQRGNIAWATGGSVGFRNAARSGYEAGYQAALHIFKRIEELQKDGPLSIQVWFKGFGQGREAFYRALMAAEGEAVRRIVSRVTDYTPIKIGGARSKKKRIL